MIRRNAFGALLLASLMLASTGTASADVSITAAGSTALLPLVKEASTLYQQQHPDVKITVNGGGSGQGLTQVAAKAVDIGDSDIIARNLPELVDHRVCVAAFALVTNSGVTVKNLSRAQLQDIFSGKKTNWKDVGGPDVKIVVVNRPRSSGTRAVFTQTIMQGKSVSESGLVEDSTGTVVSVAKQTPGAITYAVFAGVLNHGLNEISIDGVAPNEQNVVSGKYPFWSYEHMYTNGPPNKDVSRFLAFVQSKKELINKLGYVAMRDMKVTENDR